MPPPPARSHRRGGIAPLDALRDAGYGVAVVANQPTRRRTELEALGAGRRSWR